LARLTHKFVDGQTYDGLDKFNLNNTYCDATISAIVLWQKQAWMRPLSALLHSMANTLVLWNVPTTDATCSHRGTAESLAPGCW